MIPTAAQEPAFQGDSGARVMREGKIVILGIAQFLVAFPPALLIWTVLLIFAEHPLALEAVCRMARVLQVWKVAVNVGIQAHVRHVQLIK